MKAGYKTTEFWLTLFAQVVSTLVLTGVIPNADTGLLTDAAGKIAAGAVAALTLCKYIHGRTLIKTAICLLFLLSPAIASAQDNGMHHHPKPIQPAKPACTKTACDCGTNCHCDSCQCDIWKPAGKENTAFFRHDQAVERELRAHSQLLQQLVTQNAQLLAAFQQHQQIQQQPQLIVLGPEQGGPRQNIPLGGPPLQNIPLGGPPLQNIPLGGQPLQNIPIGGPPLQNVPLGEQPKQNIPLGTPLAPQQQIPLGNPSPQQMPKVPGGATHYQTYTIARVYYWRPGWR